MFSRKTIVVYIVVALCIVIYLTVSAADFLEPPTIWTLENVNAILDLDVPNKATNIKVDGYWTRSFNSLDLSFETISESEALSFTSQFCKNVLYSGYDPFNAIDSTGPSENSFQINMESSLNNFSYYSISTNTPTTVLGNRCMFSGTPINVRIDKRNAKVVQVRFHMFNACGDGCAVEQVIRNNATVH